MCLSFISFSSHILDKMWKNPLCKQYRLISKSFCTCFRAFTSKLQDERWLTFTESTIRQNFKMTVMICQYWDMGIINIVNILSDIISIGWTYKSQYINDKGSWKRMNVCIMLYSDVFTSGNKCISVYRLWITVIREAERNGMRVVLVNMISFDSLRVWEH